MALRLVSAIVIVLFFAVYTAAGLVSGGKLFDSTFANLASGWPVSPYMAGIWITAGVVVAYTMIGGFLAVSLTDFVQGRSEEHTSELQSLMRISYAVFCLKKKKKR